MENNNRFKIPPYTIEETFITCTQTMDWGVTLLNVPNIWKKTKGKGTRIAVLDTGICEHPDIQILQRINFTESAAYRNPHGTICGGIIAALDNDIGVVGVAPEAGIISVKVLDDSGSGSLKNIIKGIEWCIENKVNIINMSFGCFWDNKDLYEAVKKAYAQNIIMVAAAGNEGPQLDTVNYPAKYEEVISVGAIDKNFKVTEFSSRGDKVNIVAPGYQILSTMSPMGYGIFSGTSMATPFISGAVALLLSVHTSLKVSEVLDLLKRSAVNPNNLPSDPAYGWGIITPERLLP